MQIKMEKEIKKETKERWCLSPMLQISGGFDTKMIEGEERFFEPGGVIR